MAGRKKMTTGLPRELKAELLELGDSKKPSGANDSLRRVTGRKERRKMERQNKKQRQTGGFRQQQQQQQKQQQRQNGQQGKGGRRRQEESDDDGFSESEEEMERLAKRLKKSDSREEAPKPKSILKKPAPEKEKKSKTKTKKHANSDSDSESDTTTPHISRKSALAKLAEDDMEIAQLEKKLKIKGKKLPKSFEDDGLDFLLEGIDEIGRVEPVGSRDVGKKRKREVVEEESESESESEEGSEEEDDEESGIDDDDGGLDDMVFGSDSEDGELHLGSEEEDEGSESEDGEEGEEEDGSDDSEEDAPPQPKDDTKAAPTPIPGKYIPPSLRKAAQTEDAAMAQLTRQVKGLINRLTESNLLNIVTEIENLYRTNPRANVTSAITTTLISMTCDKSALLDTFMIIHAGFIAALYKLVGTDFGASITQRIVEEFLRAYGEANKEKPEEDGKECSNMISLLAEMYNFGVVGSVLVFDFVRMFLGELTELNTELLLKVVRNSGYQLRQDDPTSLKDLVVMLQPAIAKVGGQEKLSVRTRFMIETITNLKNNRLKTATANSAVISESTVRMKKILGSLNNRSLRATEPLRVSLDDIRNSGKEGRWWLVGASWRDPAKLAEAQETERKDGKKDDKKKDKKEGNKKKKTDGDDDIDNLGTPTDLLALARAQGMNTDIRRAIFITLMSSSDFKDCYERLLKLRLKKTQEREIPRVILHCCGNEKVHNPYYMLLAKRLSSLHHLKMAFMFCLWEVFRRMGEDEDEDGDRGGDAWVDEEGEMPMRKIVNLGKFFGGLVADDALTLGILKTLDLTQLQQPTKLFLEVFFTTIFLRLEADENKINTLIERVRDKPDLIKGLLYFINKTMVKTDIAGGKAENALCRVAAKMMGKTLKQLVALETVGEA